MQKEYYYYIDESGDLNIESKSKIFILGCIITDTPQNLKDEFIHLMNDLENDMYFLRHRKQIMNEGFHACSNHPDIYSHFVRFIQVLNFRCYFVVINKTSEYFKNLIQNTTPDQIYNDCIKKLLQDRLVKRKLDINFLIFEQNLSNPSPERLDRREKEIIGILDEINRDLIQKGYIEKEILTEIVLSNKSENILSIVDYVSHILSKIFEGKNGKVENFMKENYRLIEPKIGCIHIVDQKKYIEPRKKVFDIENALIK